MGFITELKSDSFYYLLIFVLPLLGLISSNIYTTVSSKTWYSKIRFILPDLSSDSYGLYISSYIYLFAGISLVILLTIKDGESGLGPFLGKGGGSSIDYNTLLDRTAIWCLPIGLSLNYLAQPIMYQTKNLIGPAVLDILALIFLSVFTVYTAKHSWYACMFMIPLCVWILYISIFYFTGIDELTDNNEYIILESNSVNNEMNNTVNENNISLNLTRNADSLNDNC